MGGVDVTKAEGTMERGIINHYVVARQVKKESSSVSVESSKR